MAELDNKRMDRAVQLAAAFVANGDIRMGNSTRPDSTAMAVLDDLITSLYERLLEVEQKALRN